MTTDSKQDNPRDLVTEDGAQPSQENRTTQAFSDRKAIDRAMLLPLLGCLLLVSPLLNLLQLDLRVLGIPFTALYLFAVWGLLIACAALLSRRLQHNACGHNQPSAKSAENAPE